jgi:hypothetical protein
MKKLTKEEFIEKARLKHGDKYDYSEVEYKNNYTKVRIICPEHGPFEQIAQNHLKGQGCSKCVGLCKSSTEEFIEKAKEKHGDKYDYSEVIYTNARTEVCIICPEHGPFYQTPNGHLNGNACPQCGKIKVGEVLKVGVEKFILKAKEVHGNKYDYSMVKYKDNKTKVYIICPEHGPFEQIPQNHLRGQGCPGCARIKIDNLNRSNLDEFIEKARLKHGDKYDYSEVKYVNNHTKVCIICPKHGPFYQTPNGHLNGYGCSNCRQSTLEKLVQKILKENNITFTYNERNFDWLKIKKKLQLDFYLPDYNIAIECQGIQHFIPREYLGGEEEFRNLQKRDNIKKKLCEEHGIKLYYINYDDNVEEKMNEIINHLSL